jgi:DNA modification methylase
LCACPANHLNCLSAKEWIKAQLGVWQFAYEGRDIRDKQLHPATYPIALARKVIELFTHQGELVVDPFVGSGTTLVAAQDAARNAAGFDINPKYIQLCEQRLSPAAPESHDGKNRKTPEAAKTKQIPISADARNIAKYLENETVSLVMTSPPYANLLNRRRRNKSRRGDDRKNQQYLKVEQYSQNPNDLGTLALNDYVKAMQEIFAGILPLLRPRAHCVINVADMWWENQRVPIHVDLVKALAEVGYELRNIIIWDRTNVVNRIGIFGWPSNYITMGVTFEYLLDFWRPAPK